jgi:hypothetical protein
MLIKCLDAVIEGCIQSNLFDSILIGTVYSIQPNPTSFDKSSYFNLCSFF